MTKVDPLGARRVLNSVRIAHRMAVSAMSMNRNRDRAIRAIQAEQGVKLSVAAQTWERENPEAASRYREARARLTEQTRRQPPTVNVDSYLVQLVGCRLVEVDLQPPPGVPDALITDARALEDVAVDGAKSASSGFVNWRLGMNVELSTAGRWVGALSDAERMPHVASVDHASALVNLQPARARITFHVRTKGDPPVLKKAHATLVWSPAQF